MASLRETEEPPMFPRRMLASLRQQEHAAPVGTWVVAAGELPQEACQGAGQTCLRAGRQRLRVITEMSEAGWT